MIYGIGHDLVEIERMDKILSGSAGKRLLQRILTPAEQELASLRGRTSEFAAGRFAAKEAISKALGCGIGGVLGFQDIEVLPDALGKPGVTISEEAWVRLGLSRQAGYNVHLSITHERKLASAYAVIEHVSGV
ncbi:holo-[acyl-carrier-protein] synthase [Paenibacillus sp. CAA11]|uniref:holo-ACP synthase n=1 Tax=Paenibacillus sp. CAA11 TaxID=1532905 RepID=UPI000D351FAB|nr:holo-ACP synthase [Paenibacillus sp. CAA11]AWB43340.1 holo-[acyl-carrier-protein] synthase [Paenibacillus sp. CAA11]